MTSLRQPDIANKSDFYPEILTPEAFADVMPVRPVLSTAGEHWQRITLQRYRFSSCEFTVPTTRDHRIALQLDGVAQIEAKRGGFHDRYWSEGGHFNVMPAEAPISWTIKGRPDTVILHFPQELVEETCADLYSGDPRQVFLQFSFAKTDPTIERFVHVLLDEAKDGGQESGLLVDMTSRALTARLLSRFCSNVQNTSTGRSPTLSDRRLRRTLECIHVDPSQNLSLKKLAEVGGISQSHFSRAFREAVGVSPYHYVIRLRLKLACRLLEQSELSVTEVGARCGYEQPAHFANMFRKFTGLSPSMHRKIHNG